jgi:hypothetical protein
MITVKKITEEEFNNSELPILFHEQEHARCFYLLIFNKIIILRFSAQSEIDPVVKKMGGIVAIGIDQSVGFWSIEKKEIVKTISLTSFFYDFYVSEKYIFIVCEVDILVLEVNLLKMHQELSFDEYIDHIELDKDSIKIYFTSNDVEIFGI